MRTLWFVAGTAAGVYVAGQARRAVEAVTFDGVHDRLTGWFAGAAVLRSELAAGMAEKEAELRERLQLPATSATRPRPALTTGEGLAPVRELSPARALRAPAVDD